MTQTKISPLTSDYIQELCQHKDGLQQIGVGNGANVDALESLDECLDKVYPDESERVEKARKLELLVRWHKMLASRSSSGAEQLGEVEQQIFEILQGGAAAGTAASNGTPKGAGVAISAGASKAPTSNQGISDLTAAELLKLCNHICEKGIFYLGGVTSVYLESSRPQFEWLQKIEVERSGRLRYSGNPHEKVSTLELYWCRRWMGDLATQCANVVVGFPAALDADVLDRLGLSLQASSADGESEALLAGFAID